MRYRTIFFVLLFASLPAAAESRAQTPAPMPSPEQLEQMMQTARTMMNPAAQLLAHRGEVGLSAEQVSSIEPIAARTDSVVERVLAWQRDMPNRSVAQRALADPAIELDEAAIRAEAREAADVQAGLTIAMLRAMRDLQGILTEPQMEAWMQIQVNASMRMMQGMIPGS